MLNLDSAVAFELFPCVAADAVNPHVPNPDMKGHIARAYHLEGHFVINEETGQKHLEIKVLDDASFLLCRGALFRDPLVPGGRHYTGFLNCQEEPNPSGFTPRRWQIELSGVVDVGLHPANSCIRGRAYLPRDAAEHSFNDALKETGIGF